ncbi:hypothetical protein FMUAM8_07470 [Nocardia cyriacigeorgica]|nr:hypothetical protein FMUAM8_07470 [Nocardia cyriacigeorgica]
MRACSPTRAAGAPVSAPATPAPAPAMAITPTITTDIRRIPISFHNPSSPTSYPRSGIALPTDAVPPPHTR